jgi:uncharacterized protein (TIGR03437 family)
VVLFAPAFLWAQQDRIAGPISETRMVALKGNVSPRAQPQFDRGPVDPARKLDLISLVFKPTPEQQADLEQLLNQQQDRSSPQYHRWLTPEQYADRFGLAPGDIAKIRTWLQAQGFTVGYVARSRNWISFSGTAAQVAQSLHTEIHSYQVDAETHFANVSEPAIPSELEPVVLGYIGLDNFASKPSPARVKHLGPQLTLSDGTNVLAPDDMAKIYDISRLYQAGIDGSGTKIGIMGASSIDLADIAAFQSSFGLPANVPKVMLALGAASPGKTGAEVEADLDIEWAGAVARNAQITYVYSPDVITSATYAISENVAPVISLSFGGCESENSLSFRNVVKSVADQGNAQGVTWLVASGDSGAAGCDAAFSGSNAVRGFGVSFPASMPEVTAVGGAEFNEGTGTYWSSSNSSSGESALAYIPETSWNESDASGLAASGGGYSVLYSQPSWQAGPGLSVATGRAIPDISAAAAGHDGYAVYSEGQLYLVYGTSAPTPFFAGMIALLNQKEGAGGVGNINSNLYRLAQTNIFHDITTGDNVVPCLATTRDCAGGSFGYSAGPGYDPVTGLGSIDAYNLVNEWNAATPVSKIVPACTPNPVFEQTPDAQGNGWFYTVSLTETAGVATELTGFTINGADNSTQIPNYFGSATIPAHGVVSANLTVPGQTAPATFVFGFSGVDAGGRSWSQQLSVPFNGMRQSAAPSPSISSVVNAASYQPGISPGALATLFGSKLSPVAGIESTGGAISYQGVSVTVGGRLAPLFAVSNVDGQEQINFQVPADLPASGADVSVQVNNNGSIGTAKIAIDPIGPGVFEYFPAGSSTAYGILVRPDGSVVGPSTPAARGTTVVMYMTGLGPTSPALATGQLGPVPLAFTTNAVAVQVNGMDAAVLFSGVAPGFIGLDQVNFTIPAQAPVGSADTLSVAVNGVASQKTAIAVQ